MNDSVGVWRAVIFTVY